jgi:hypothetical protein
MADERDPKHLAADDAGAPQRASRAPAFDRDASAEEAAELRRLADEERERLRAARWASVQDSVTAIVAKGADPAVVAAREVTAASLAAMEFRRLDAEATLRGVPTDPDVRDVALRRDPSGTDQLETVAAVLGRRGAKPGRPRPCLLVLLGPPGTGKSCALAWAVTHHARTSRFATAALVAASLRNGHSEARAAWDRLLAPDLLAVDELGREHNPGAVVELVIDRWSAGKATLLCGNLEPDAFRARYPDPALRSRMHLQVSRGEPCLVVLSGDDMRRGGGER